MADSKRRGEDAVDERVDDVLDEDALADDLDEQLLDDEDDAAVRGDEVVRRKGGGTATKPRPSSRPRPAPAGRRATKIKDADRIGVFARLAMFVREVVAELRKVIWPTRKELLTYTAVVIVFVTIMFTIVASLDYGFAWAMFKVFAAAKK